MWRVIGLVVIILVASNAVCWEIVAVIPVMALIATNGGMFTSQCIVGIMKGECGWLPARICRMAICTGRWNLGCMVIGIGRGIKGSQMTRSTIFCQASETAICMTTGTIKIGVSQGQGEEIMIYIRRNPCKTVYRMTLDAVF
jgi:hypothetical protein